MTFVEKGELECGASPRKLWPVITDTDRVNRVAGLAWVESTPRPQGLIRHRVKTKLGPVTVEYDEYPFEWVAPERYSVRRDFLSGPLERYEISYSLTPTATGTHVSAELRCELRFSGLGPVAPPIMRTILSKLLAAMKRLDKELVSAEPLPDLMESQADPQALQSALERLRAKLDPQLHDAAAALAAWVQSGSDIELVRIRPFAQATRWSIPRPQALELCLQAVLAGLLELSWDLLCPSCQVPLERQPLLSAFEGHGVCPVCDLRFEADFDSSIEATFKPTLAVRAVKERRYCTGGPGVTPHIVAQANLQADEPLRLSAPAEPGRYRVFARGGAQARLEVAQGAPDQAELAVEHAALVPPQLALAPKGTLVVTDRTGEPRHLKLEHLAWASDAATAMDVNLSPTFRRYFQGQVLRSELTLKISWTALLFTDLSGSTALYTRAGDAAAFKVVQRHFDVLRRPIEQCSGTIVKTIGDAIMVAFKDEVDALHAGLQMQRAFAEFRASEPDCAQVGLKVGVHAGPCYAVTANGAIDYFGQTVNLAARLEGQAKAGQVVASKEVYERAQGSALLQEFRLLGTERAALKGIEGDFELVRLQAEGVG